MSQQSYNQGKYFDYLSYINSLIKDLKMDTADESIKEELREELTTSLSERINAVLVTSMTERDLQLLEEMILGTPDVDLIDAISIIAPGIEGLAEKLLKEVDDFYEEILTKAKLLDDKILKF